MFFELDATTQHSIRTAALNKARNGAYKGNEGDGHTSNAAKLLLLERNRAGR